MISEKKAMEMLGEDLVKAYHEIHKVQGPWGTYVSLPFIYSKFGTDLAKFFDRKVTVFVHPGHAIYTEGLMVLVKKDEKEYGNYEKEYFEPLMRRFAEACKNKEKIVVHVSNNKLNELLQMLGTEDVILVPTLPGENEIDAEILGVDRNSLYKFMKEMGVEEAESNGEFKDQCYSFVNDDMGNAGIEVSQNIHYPVRGSHYGLLFYMTEEEDVFYQSFCRQFDEWCQKTYKEYTSKLGIKDDSCEAIILREAIKCTTNDYIHPWILCEQCKPWSKEEVVTALKKLERHGLLRIGSAKDLDKESLRLYNAFNRMLEAENEKCESDEIIFPLIECELFND